MRLPPLPLNAWLRWDVVRRVLRSLDDVTRVLEVGAGQGAVGVRLAGEYDYVAIEPDRASFARARKRLERLGRGTVHCGDSSALPAGATFDLVCAFEVLEHIEDDERILREWRDLLGERGWLLLSVPAHRRRYGPHDRLVGHYRRYDTGQIAELLVRTGYAKPVVLTCGFPFGYLLEAARNLLARRHEPAGSMAEQTAMSGRWLQPPDWLGALTRIVAAPFCLLQRPFLTTSLGTGLVVLAQRAS